MAVGFKTISITPAAAVATDGTMTFTYASGNASQWAQAGEILVAAGLMTVFEQASDTFTLAYGSSSVVVTYKGDTSIPAGTLVTLQLPVATYVDLTDLTDSSGGTASGTLAAITAGASYAQADATATKNAIASLAAKIAALNAMVNELKGLSQERDNVPNDDRN